MPCQICRFDWRVWETYSGAVNKIAPQMRVVPKQLDVAQLEALAEPLTIQINRIKNNQYSPIPAPILHEGGQAGLGWTKAEVIEMNTSWLVKNWTGGGHYEFTITDSSQPPQTMTWRSWWSPSEFPELIPPPMAGGQYGVLANPSQQPQQVAFMGDQLNRLPQGIPNAAPAAPAPMGYPQPMYQPMPMPMYQAPQPQYSYQQQVEQRRMEERLALAEQALARAQLENQQRQHAAELERVRAESASVTQRLEQRIADLVQAMQQNANTKPNDEVMLLKSKLEQTERDREADRREREAERRELATRDAMMAQINAINAQIAQQQQNFQQLLTSSQNKSDPLLQLVLQQNRDSMAAMERISQGSASAMDRMQNFMMRPTDVMAMAKESSSGLDAATSKMADQYGRVLDMQQKVLQTHLEAQPQGSPVVDLVREGVTSVKDMATRFLATSARSKQAESQAQAQAATANAQARRDRSAVAGSCRASSGSHRRASQLSRRLQRVRNLVSRVRSRHRRHNHRRTARTVRVSQRSSSGASRRMFKRQRLRRARRWRSAICLRPHNLKLRVRSHSLHNRSRTSRVPTSNGLARSSRK